MRCEWVHTHHNVCTEVRRQLVEVSSLPLPQKPWRGDSSFPAWHQVSFSVEATRHSLSYLDSPLSLRLASHFLVQSQTHSRSLHIHEIKWFIFIHLLPFSRWFSLWNKIPSTGILYLSSFPHTQTSETSWWTTWPLLGVHLLSGIQNCARKQTGIPQYCWAARSPSETLCGGWPVRRQRVSCVHSTPFILPFLNAHPRDLGEHVLWLLQACRKTCKMLWFVARLAVST